MPPGPGETAGPVVPVPEVPVVPPEMGEYLQKPPTLWLHVAVCPLLAGQSAAAVHRSDDVQLPGISLPDPPEDIVDVFLQYGCTGHPPAGAPGG